MAHGTLNPECPRKYLQSQKTKCGLQALNFHMCTLRAYGNAFIFKVEFQNFTAAFCCSEFSQSTVTKSVAISIWRCSRSCLERNKLFLTLHSSHCLHLRTNALSLKTQNQDILWAWKLGPEHTHPRPPFSLWPGFNQIYVSSISTIHINKASHVGHSLSLAPDTSTWS